MRTHVKAQVVHVATMPENKLQQRLDLIKMKVDILKIKADDYNWCCHVPDNVKAELEKALEEINTELNKLKGDEV